MGDGGALVHLLDAGRVELGAEAAAGIIALFLECADFAVEAAKHIDHLGKGGEVALDVIGFGELLEEDLGETRGGGLKADFGQFGGVIAAEVSDEVILIEAVLKDEVLLELPFEVAAAGDPIGDIAFGDGIAALAKGQGDIFVGNGVAQHVADHVALDLGEVSDTAAAAAVMVRGGGRESLGFEGGGCLLLGEASGELARLGGCRCEGEGWRAFREADGVGGALGCGWEPRLRLEGWGRGRLR